MHRTVPGSLAMISTFDPKNTPAEDRLMLVPKRAADACALRLKRKKHEILSGMPPSIPYLVRSFGNSQLGSETGKSAANKYMEGDDGEQCP